MVGDPEAAAQDQVRKAMQKERRASMVADALELNRFPPDSRPLTRDMTDVLSPNRRQETPLPVRVPGKRGERLNDDEVPYFLFTGKKHSISQGEPLEATIEFFRKRPDPSAQPDRIPAQQLTCRLMRYGQPEFVPVVDVPLNDDGANGDEVAGDLIYSVVFDPTSIDALRAYNGYIQLEAQFSLASVPAPVRAVLMFELAAVPPARFAGVLREELTADGLVIHMGVDVVRAGYYFVQGLLFDSQGNPIGFAVHRETWQAGRQDAPLLFFGLLFHEAHASGPYVFKTVTGTRLPDDGEPVKTDIPMWTGEYRTRAYSLDRFSDREWESDQKARLIENLQQLADENPDKIPVPPDGTGVAAHPRPSSK